MNVCSFVAVLSLLNGNVNCDGDGDGDGNCNGFALFERVR